LHGVEVSRRATDSSWNQVASELLIRRICVRYEDGRKVCFVPEAREEFFSRDDVQRVVGMLHIGSETLEWDPAPERPRRGEIPGHGAVRHRRRLTSGVVLSWRWLACPASGVKSPKAIAAL
jgi:hypothetical protein